MNLSSPPLLPQILCSSAGRTWNGLDAALVHIPRGRTHVGGSGLHTLGIHIGPPVNADCSCDGVRLRHVQKQGDIGFVPAGMDSSWEDDADCQILRLSLHPSLLQDVAEELGRDATKIDLIPQLQLRDSRIEAISWAIKADLEADTPSNPLYIDHLASALAVRLIETVTDNRPLAEVTGKPKMPPRHLKLLIEYIDTNLDQHLRLADVATVTGIGVTRLKTLFRNSMGMSLHQYVIRRRVEYARTLIATTTMPAAEIALAAGFAHQSHMSSTMRRVLGQHPSDIDRPLHEIRPNLIKPVRI